MHTAPKIKVFLWSTCQNALATKLNLYQRHIIPHPNCYLCNNSEPESLEHLFFFCPWTTAIWNHEDIRVSISPTSVSRFDAWVVDRISLPQASPNLEAIVHILWEIWRHRNNAVFHQLPMDPLLVVSDALSQSTIFKILQPLPKKIQNAQASLEQRWNPPAEGLIKCNIDGAFRPDSNKGSIACIYKDNKGRLTDVLTRSVSVQTAFQAEIYALISALQRLIQKGIHL